MSATQYRRLPGKRRTLVGVSSLHLGPDHILQVRSTRLSEEYSRFYFQDVQSILVRKSAPFHYGWAALIVLMTFVVARGAGDMLAPIGVVAVGGVFLWLRGPTCVVQLHTAVTSSHLSSLHRLKTAMRVVAMLRDEIEAVQGRVVSVPDAFAPSAPVPPPLPFAPATLGMAARGKDHLYFFSYLSVETIVLGAWLAQPRPMLGYVAAVGTLVEFLALVMLLIRQTRQRIPRLLRNVTYVALGRWFLMQMIATLTAYKAVLVDGTRRTVDPLSFTTGTLTRVTFVSLVLMSLVGLWLSLRSTDE